MMKKQQGIGLIEIMVSLFIASIILVIMSQLYLSSKSHYLKIQAKLEESFEIQWISDLLSDSIRRAGFTPCMGIEQLESVDLRSSPHQLNALISSKNVLQINRMYEWFTEAIKIHSPIELEISNNINLHEHQALILSNCKQAEVHGILKQEQLGTRQLITLTEPLRFDHQVHLYLGAWLEERWFIKNKPGGERALYYHLSRTEELSSLIDSLFVEQKIINGKGLVKVSLGLRDGNEHEFSVVVRGS